MTERTRVLVADDHPMFRSALEEAIKGRPDLELVGTADNGRVAIEEIRRLHPDVAVIDMRMPELDGSDVLNAVMRDQLPTRMLFLSTHTDGGMVYDLLARGAAGYLDKVSSGGEVCDAISAVSHGQVVLTRGLDTDVLQQIRLRGDDGDGTPLSAREGEVLKLVAGGLSAPDIATRLYIEVSTVKTHLQNIYEKLGVSERAAAVAEGMRRGLVE
jgi:two-component system nitrate/nitrite response regulator NarL